MMFAEKVVTYRKYDFTLIIEGCNVAEAENYICLNKLWQV
jgi:hypothetical protein